MIKYLLSTLFLFSTLIAFSQCDEIFISEYVEGSGNNRALEIYNPTDQVIDLSEYSFGRFRNGGNTLTSSQIPAGNTIGPDETFVIVIDKRDSLGTGFETAVWNGYVLFEASIDTLTGEVRLNNEGDTILYPVRDEELGRYLYSNHYREEYDLQSRADLFVNPVYQSNTSYFYFNGNDAVAIIKGTQISNDGSNIIDVVGVIGEDPELDGNPYWTDGLGRRMTQNSTLVRDPNIEEGTGIVLTGQDTFPYGEWIWFRNNTFTNLGEHLCVCHDDVANEDVFSSDLKLNIFPNPVVKNTISIRANEVIASLELISINGQLLLSQTEVNQRHYQWNLSVVSAGSYIVRVKSKTGSIAVHNLIVR